MLDTIYKMSLSTQVIMQLFAYAAVLVCCTGSSISSIRHFMLIFWRYIYLYTNQCCYYISHVLKHNDTNVETRVDLSVVLQ